MAGNLRGGGHRRAKASSRTRVYTSHQHRTRARYSASRLDGSTERPFPPFAWQPLGPDRPCAKLDADGSIAKAAPRAGGKGIPMLPLVLSSDSHVFEPPDLWQTRMAAAFRDRAPRIERIDGGDHVVVEADLILSGIGLISNAGARFEAPETISAQGRFEDVHRGGYDPDQHLTDME